MNKIIWKDIDSTDIKGLMICELPPITKPKMRVQETTIDGVDGSIIEELGYESYDKTITIALTKNYDIDEVIEYFTGEGNVTFSNEPERYYKARIIEQIDYERLLRYRTAEVTFRVQPFKYEYQEVVSSLNSYSPEGEIISINKSDIKLTQVKVEGECEQETTQGYNLYNNEYKISDNGLTSTKEQIENGVKVTITAVNSAISQPGFFLNIKSTIDNLGLADGENILIKYKFKTTNTSSFNQSFGNWEAGKNLTWSPSVSQTYTNWTERRVLGKFNATAQYGQFSFYSPNISVGDVYEIKDFMISKSSVDLPYEQYTGGSASPNPDYPSEINTIKSNANLEVNSNDSEFDGEMEIGTLVGSTGNTSTADNRLRTKNFSNVKPNTKYYLKVATANVESFVFEYDGNSKFIQRIPTEWTKENPYEFVTSSTTKKVKFIFRFTDDAIMNVDDIKGIALYTKENTVSVSLNDNELCSIGDIKDEVIIENGKAKIIKRIGKVVLNGSEKWATPKNNEYAISKNQINNINAPNATTDMISNFFRVTPYGDSGVGYIRAGYDYLNFNYDNNAGGVDNFKKWLSENNVIVYYLLAEPYEVDLGTITTLNLYEGQTNISNNSDANMVVNYVDNKLIVTNLGNYISKPVITIRGEGTIEFTLNNEHLFNYTFPEGEEEVVIDSQKQDAYLGTILKNRNMIGEFPIFKVGANTITWNGHITSIDISSKSRWL